MLNLDYGAVLDRPLSTLSLAELASNINQEISLAESSLLKALQHARNTGIYLLQAKSQIKHGLWGTWLKDNCPRLSETTAQNYMRVARGWHRLLEESDKCEITINQLTVRKALKLLARTQKSDKPVEEIFRHRGWVYLIKAPLHNHSRYKIGQARNVQIRLIQIQASSPIELILVHSISCENPKVVEAYLHSTYCDKRLHGEWFVLSDADVEEITAIHQVKAKEL